MFQNPKSNFCTSNERKTATSINSERPGEVGKLGENIIIIIIHYFEGFLWPVLIQN
jgi:hypothetical protein